MNIDRHISGNQITWAITLILGLMCAAFLGSAVGGQNLLPVGLFIGLGTVVAIMISLGSNYWLLIPLSIGATLPAIPIAGRTLDTPELAIVVCVVMFFLRLATRKETLRVFHIISVPVLLYTIWVFIVFLSNPVGLAMLGSQYAGARFYFKLALAFASFVILSSRVYSQKDMKHVMIMLIVGSTLSMIYAPISYYLTPQGGPSAAFQADEFYTWHQSLSLPAVTICMLLFSRWKPSEIFSLHHLGLVVVYAGCFALVLLSGKRMALLTMLIVPLVSAVVHRQLSVILSATALFFIILGPLVVGQGNYFSLPLVVQRTLSWLPGEWDPELSNISGGADDWRAELRRIAWESAQLNPWFGKGYAVNVSETVFALSNVINAAEMQDKVMPFALGRSWHNTWIGYSADFGIPLAVIQACLLGTVLVISFRLFKLYGASSMFGVFSLYVFIFTCRDAIASHTSGHSSVDAFNRWWMYGVLVSLYVQMLKEKTTLRESKSGLRPPRSDSEDARLVPARRVQDFVRPL